MQLDSVDYTENVQIEELRPYLRLWGAVMKTGIDDAALDYFNLLNGEDTPSSSATYWFESDDYFPGSFTWLCELFQIDADRARDRVRYNFREIARNAPTRTKPKDAARPKVADKTTTSTLENTSTACDAGGDTHSSEPLQPPYKRNRKTGGK